MRMPWDGPCAIIVVDRPALRLGTDAFWRSFSVSGLVAALTALHLDLVFLGVHGMDVSAGFTTPNLLEAETNRAMVSSGRRLVVLSDSTKWGVVGLSSMATLTQAGALITDDGLSRDARDQLTEHVGELVVVEPHAEAAGTE